MILAAPSPTWVKAADNPTAYDSIDYFIRTIIDADRGAGPAAGLRRPAPLRPLRRAGPAADHLRRRRGVPAIPPTSCRSGIEVPPRDTLARRASRTPRVRPGGPLPGRGPLPPLRLGRLRPAAAAATPASPRCSAPCTRCSCWRWPGAAANWTDGTDQRLFSVPLVIMVVVTLLAAVLFAKPPSASGKRHARHWILGVGHGVAHVALAAAGTWAWLHLPFYDWPWPLPAVAAAVLYGPVIGLVASQLVAAVPAGGRGVRGERQRTVRRAGHRGLEELPAAAHRPGRHADRSTRSAWTASPDDWQVNPDQSPTASWLTPEAPLTPT